MAKKVSNTKRDYLKSKVEHIDITKIDAVDIDAFKRDSEKP